jgi:hypothetical protein
VCIAGTFWVLGTLPRQWILRGNGGFSPIASASEAPIFFTNEELVAEPCGSQDFGVDSIHPSGGSFHAVSREADSRALSASDRRVGICFCRSPAFQFARRNEVYGLRRCALCFPICDLQPTNRNLCSGSACGAGTTSIG